ncbi:unnamed protein product [Leptidea sinapis]|uniref:Uncharacterized protein n=1 Tax=Leptidea sinapis TaxID=189913 RepID=A0A5E4R4C9_9NEOP|nr:unnamed protein product [Leptidea sinapis]
MRKVVWPTTSNGALDTELQTCGDWKRN